MTAPLARRNSAHQEIFRRPVGRLAADLREGAISARELLDHYLERIDRLNAKINAFVFLDPSAALAADASDKRLKSGRALSPLDGIPVAVKDNLFTRGCPAVWGSRLFEGKIVDHDERPVARLRESGAVLLGKTNVPEFALRGYTNNQVYGVTRNPWDATRTPGGSSGGAAAALAAGLAPLALATDGGGSIRRPAGHAGLAGLKPTIGRIRRGKGFPRLMFDCEVAGPMARSVADMRLMFAWLAQPGAAVTAPPQRARILFIERFGEAPVAPVIVESCREAAARLAALGHTVSHGGLPISIDAAMFAWQAIINAGLAQLARLQPRFFEIASPDFIEQAKIGERLSGIDYAALIDTLFEFRARVAEIFDGIDIIMTPTAAAQPWPAGEAFPRIIAKEKVGPRGHAVFTGWVNACGHPAIALPARPDSDGMPIGFQLVGAAGADETLFDIAEEYETAHPWAQSWPAMAINDQF